jgi:uncharacterized SAM-binding protein YcdF (DUF218 family)
MGMNEFLQTYSILFIVLGLAIANLWRRRHESRRRLLLVTVTFAALVVLNLPGTGYLALGTLEWHYPPDGLESDDAETIVVLSGSLMPADSVRHRVELGDDTLVRCVHALDLYRRSGPRPVLVSGGRVDPNMPGPTLARAMAGFLRDSGVKDSDLIMEEHSRTTYENAVESCRLLRGRGITKIVLVTEAYHMYRAMRCFEGQGMEVVPSACHHRATQFRFRLADFLPSPSSARNCQVVVHEWLGVVWYRLRGRI